MYHLLCMRVGKTADAQACLSPSYSPKQLLSKSHMDGGPYLPEPLLASAWL